MKLNYHKWRASALRYYRAIAKYTNVLNLPVYSDESFISEQFDKTTNKAIEKERYACKAVLDLMKTDYPDPIKKFFEESGKRYAMTRNNEECKRFLKDYYSWLKEQYKPIVLPDIEIPSPEFGSLKEVKRSLQISVLFIVGVILLIFYMISGKGEKGITV